MKILTLNVQCGVHINALRKLLIRAKGSIDVFCFQEVAGGYRYQLQYQNNSFDINHYRNNSLFIQLNNMLRDQYQGKLVKSYCDKTGNNYLGNAVFYKNNIRLLQYNGKFMGSSKYVDINEKDHKNVRYSYQILKLMKDGSVLNIINTHMMKVVADPVLARKYFRKISQDTIKMKGNVIVCGDFNIDKSHSYIKKYFNHLTCLNVSKNIKNTLNKSTHVLFKKKPKSKGCSVDQIYISKNLNGKTNMTVEKINVSDHYPIYCDIDI